MHPSRLLIVAVALAALLACETATEPRANPTVSLTGFTPVSDAGLLLRYEVTNPTTRPIYLLECGGNVFASVDVVEPSGHADTWSTICLGIWTVNRIRVGPGDTYSGVDRVGQRPWALYSITVQYLADEDPASEPRSVSTRRSRWRPSP